MFVCFFRFLASNCVSFSRVLSGREKKSETFRNLAGGGCIFQEIARIICNFVGGACLKYFKKAYFLEIASLAQI